MMCAECNGHGLVSPLGYLQPCACKRKRDMMTDTRDDAPPAHRPEDIARELGVHRETVYRWIKSGRLRATKIGPRLWRVEAADYERFKAGGEQ